MNLKLLNVLAIALLAVAWRERRRPETYGKLLWAAALVDAVILITLMTHRGAATTAGTLAMTPSRVIHILASALFPLLYPFLLVADGDAIRRGDRLARGLLVALLVLRLTSFWTSYFMGTV